MAFWDKEESLITFDKNKTEKIEVKHCEIKGKEFIDIRTLFKGDNDDWKPSSKGVAIPADRFKEISDLVLGKLQEPKDAAE